MSTPMRQLARSIGKPSDALKAGHTPAWEVVGGRGRSWEVVGSGALLRGCGPLTILETMDALPARPATVVAGALVLLTGAVTLLGMWLLGLDAVESNGARVFFVVLWAFLGWSAYAGGGWVRTAIVAIFAVTAWGWLNAPSVGDALAAMSKGDLVAKGMALVALGALLAPDSRRWFAAAREIQSRAAETN